MVNAFRQSGVDLLTTRLLHALHARVTVMAKDMLQRLASKGALFLVVLNGAFRRLAQRIRLLESVAKERFRVPRAGDTGEGEFDGCRGQVGVEI